MPWRHVERHLEILVFAKEDPCLPEGRRQYLPCHRLNSSARLGERNKVDRRNDGAVSAYPPRQHFASDYFAGAEFKYRLEERLELVPRQSLVDIGYRPLQPRPRLG